jgi:hypothetical protein
MKYLQITDDAYEWFQKARKITLKDKRKLTIQENELLILMLNMWEAGNMGKQVSDCIEDSNIPFPKQIFEHYNGKFYRSG